MREHELNGLLEALGTLDLRQFVYQSFHSPSALCEMSSCQLVDSLLEVVEFGMPIVVHPDIIGADFSPWRELGRNILLENMDSRKPVCRTAREMVPFFEQLPEARFCFDIGHAHQIDPTMSVAVELMLRFRDRIAEVHISEVNWECKHTGISTATAYAFHEVARLIPDETPIIIESVINATRIDRELAIVRRCLDYSSPFAPLQQEPAIVV